MRILVVEDDDNMAQAICELLKQEHYSTDLCGDGISGEDAVLTGVYDVAILSIWLMQAMIRYGWLLRSQQSRS